MLEQRRTAARSSILDFARTLERRAAQVTNQPDAGDSATAASADLRCAIDCKLALDPWVWDLASGDIHNSLAHRHSAL